MCKTCDKQILIQLYILISENGAACIASKSYGISPKLWIKTTPIINGKRNQLITSDCTERLIIYSYKLKGL